MSLVPAWTICFLGFFSAKGIVRWTISSDVAPGLSQTTVVNKYRYMGRCSVLQQQVKLNFY